jgi:flagellar biosynthetic protein FliR
LPFEVWFSDFHHFFFVFARVFGLVMGMPFLSQIEVSSKFRAVACIALTLTFNPLVPDDYFPTAQTFTLAFCRFFSEFLVGFFLGLIARFALAAVEFAGQIIGFAAGISSATVFNPSQANHGSVVSVFLTMAAMTSFLVLDGHHMLFKNLIGTYSKLPPEWFSLESPLLNDFFKGIVTLSDMLMKAGFQLSIPFLLVNTVLQFALGVLGKLVPQIQVFFLGMSLQILLGWFVLLVSFGAMLLFYEKLNTSAYSIMGFAHG